MGHFILLPLPKLFNTHAKEKNISLITQSLFFFLVAFLLLFIYFNSKTFSRQLLRLDRPPADSEGVYLGPSADMIYPKHQGSKRCYFSKLAPSASCRGVRLRFKARQGGGRDGGGAPLLRSCSPLCHPPLSPDLPLLLLPCRLPPREKPFEGVITAACITWVTAIGSWSQLMKPLRKPPGFLRFLFKFWGVGVRPDPAGLSFGSSESALQFGYW